MDIYEPQEDSLLIKRHIGEFAKGAVLDMGTGSGILAEEAAKTADAVIALDINPKAIDYCKRTIKNHKIIFYQSNLFEMFEIGKLNRVFDLILFNAPYLPKEKPHNVALDGGPQGYELIEKFLRKAKNYLKPQGKILLVFSSLTKKPKIDSIIDGFGYRRTLVDAEQHAFETLYVYLLEK